MRRLVWCLALVGAAAGCRHAYPVKPGGSCTPEPGAGCVDKGGEPGLLVVKNLSKVEICHTHLRPSSADDWTEPVDDATSIPAGQALEFRIKGTDWDVKVSDCKGGVVAEQLRVPVAGGAQLTFGTR